MREHGMAKVRRARSCGAVLARVTLIAVSFAGLTAGVGPVAAMQKQPAGNVEGLVDVGGYRLYLNCTGEGRPTVIIDNALATPSFTWREGWGEVQPAVASFTRVCTYDRAWIAPSDPGPVPRSSTIMVEELRTLLRNAGVEGPYVLVGHSLGGLNMELFARLHPSEVVGVVFIDATPAHLYDRFGEVLTAEQLALLTPTPDQNPEHADLLASLAEVKAAQVTRPFPQVPVIVLVRTDFSGAPPGFPEAELARLWNEMQVDQAGFSSRSELFLVQGARHYIYLDRPDVVIESIRRVVEAARALSRPGKGCGDSHHLHLRALACGPNGSTRPTVGDGLASMR